MRTNKNITNKGWHENRDVLTGRAPLHTKVALKNKFDKEHISNTVEIVPGLEELTLRFDNSEGFLGLVERFKEETDIFIKAEAEDDEFIVKLLADEAELFLEFLAHNGIKPKEDDFTIVKSSDELNELESKKQQVDDIIAYVQNERSKRAINKDEMITAEKTGNKENTGDLIAWVRNPGKSDLQGVDNNQS